MIARRRQTNKHWLNFHISLFVLHRRQRYGNADVFVVVFVVLDAWLLNLLPFCFIAFAFFMRSFCCTNCTNCGVSKWGRMLKKAPFVCIRTHYIFTTFLAYFIHWSQTLVSHHCFCALQPECKQNVYLRIVFWQVKLFNLIFLNFIYCAIPFSYLRTKTYRSVSCCCWPSQTVRLFPPLLAIISFVCFYCVTSWANLFYNLHLPLSSVITEKIVTDRHSQFTIQKWTICLNKKKKKKKNESSEQNQSCTDW